MKKNNILLVILVSFMVVFSITGCSDSNKLSTQNKLSDSETDLLINEINNKAKEVGMNILNKGEVVILDIVKYPDFTGKKMVTFAAGYVPVTLGLQSEGMNAPPVKYEIFFEVGFEHVVKKNVSEKYGKGDHWMTQYLSKGVCDAGDAVKQQEYRNKIVEEMKEVRNYAAKVKGT